MHQAAHAHRPYRSFLQTLIRNICVFIVIVDLHSNTRTPPARRLPIFPEIHQCWWRKFSILTAAEREDVTFHQQKSSRRSYNGYQYHLKKCGKIFCLTILAFFAFNIFFFFWGRKKSFKLSIFRAGWEKDWNLVRFFRES